MADHDALKHMGSQDKIQRTAAASEENCGSGETRNDPARSLVGGDEAVC